MAKKVREFSDFLILLRISPHEIWRQNIMIPELPMDMKVHFVLLESFGMKNSSKLARNKKCKKCSHPSGF